MKVADQCAGVDAGALKNRLRHGMTRPALFEDLGLWRRTGTIGSPHLFSLTAERIEVLAMNNLNEVTADSSGARLSVCFSFDGLGGWVGDSRDPADLSRGEVAAVAVPRTLDLLDRRNTKHGHEIGHHRWIHESAAEFEAGQQDIFARGLAAPEAITGERPIVPKEQALTQGTSDV